MIGTGRGARAGVLIRDAEALQALDRVDTLVIDKTGTLTEGKPRVIAVAPWGSTPEADLLQFAAAVERNSEHPLARAIVEAAEARGLPGVSNGAQTGPRIGVEEGPPFGD